MKRFFTWALLLALACGTVSCEYDDDELQQRVDELEEQVATLQSLVDALNAGKYVVQTETDANGAVVLVFNDGSKVSVGTPGETLFFTSIEETEDAVTITTSDGRVITLPKTSLSAAFAEGEDGRVKAGETRDLALVLTNVADCVVVSEGNPDWSFAFTGTALQATAPVELTESNTTAEIRLLLRDANDNFKMVKLTLTAYYDLRVLTFEDADYKGTGNYLGNKDWSSLIDSPQYGGALLYGPNGYSATNYAWYDEGNTCLSSALIDGGPFWNGGHVISNYFLSDFSGASYTEQLAVSTGSEGAAGHNGSKNFCVQNGYVDAASYKQVLPSFYFADGNEHVVDHMYVTNTSYALNSLTYGDSFAAPASDESWFRIVATGFDAQGEETGTVEFYLCAEGRQIIKEWTKFDLSPLGKVAKIAFNIQGSDDLCGDWGLNTPAYFAYDDVTVRF